MQVFEQAVELDAAERAAFLDEACATDLGLRSRVEALIRADEEIDASFLEEIKVDDALLDTIPKGGPASSAPAEIGETLGAYLLTGLIGRGAMGWVFRARHAVLGRDVAIKLLAPELVRDPDRDLKPENWGTWRIGGWIPGPTRNSLP